MTAVPNKLMYGCVSRMGRCAVVKKEEKIVVQIPESNILAKEAVVVVVVGIHLDTDSQSGNDFVPGHVVF
jgi:hypothetical protein